jgi:hypothetical protein
LSSLTANPDGQLGRYVLPQTYAPDFSDFDTSTAVINTSLTPLNVHTLAALPRARAIELLKVTTLFGNTLSLIAPQWKITLCAVMCHSNYNVIHLVICYHYNRQQLQHY